MNFIRYKLAKALLHSGANGLLSERTRKLVQFDMLRYKVRHNRKGISQFAPDNSRLHLGSGTNKVNGWLNVDLTNSDYDWDIASGRLPWLNHVFDSIVCQHVIEHLELEAELIPLLRELSRVLKPTGELWLSCPDIAKACTSYTSHQMKDLIADRNQRRKSITWGEVPTSHFINDLFQQQGEHRNLFDFQLLEWALRKSGFSLVTLKTEHELLKRFPDFPPRHDDAQSIYVMAQSS